MRKNSFEFNRICFLEREESDIIFLNLVLQAGMKK